MIHRYALAFLGFGTIASGFSQTLTDASNSVRPGDIFTVHVAPYQSPGNSGADQTWDFSGLGITTTLTYTHVTPAASGYAASFPASTVAQQLSSGEVLFVQADAAGMWQWGEVNNTEVHAYTDPERIMTYPCSFGTTWEDDFGGTFVFSGMNTVRTGTFAATADGYGTLIMPYGTLDNVLRVQAVQVTTDTYDMGSQVTDFDVYYFYRVGVHYPVVTVIDGVVTTTFGSFPIQTISWIEEGTVGVSEALQQAIGVQLFPNPAHDQVNVVFTSDGNTASVLEVIDATGRIIHQQGLGQRSSGIQLEQLDLTGFAPGVYSLSITDGRGGRGVQRLVIE
jgi:hypothetical protein